MNPGDFGKTWGSYDDKMVLLNYTHHFGQFAIMRTIGVGVWNLGA